jgi:hypothetical protein
LGLNEIRSAVGDYVAVLHVPDGTQQGVKWFSDEQMFRVSCLISNGAWRKNAGGMIAARSLAGRLAESSRHGSSEYLFHTNHALWLDTPASWSSVTTPNSDMRPDQTRTMKPKRDRGESYRTLWRRVGYVTAAWGSAAVARSLMGR